MRRVIQIKSKNSIDAYGTSEFDVLDANVTNLILVYSDGTEEEFQPYPEDLPRHPVASWEKAPLVWGIKP